MALKDPQYLNCQAESPMNKEANPRPKPAAGAEVVDIFSPGQQPEDNPRRIALARAGLEMARKQTTNPETVEDRIPSAPISETIKRRRILARITAIESSLETAWADYFELFCPICDRQHQSCQCPQAQLHQIRPPIET